MSIRQGLFGAACAFLAVVLWTSPVLAQNKGALGAAGTEIRVVDMDEISRKAAAAKDIREQLEKYRSQFQADIQNEEEELRKANQELARKRALLAPEVFADERRKFEQRVVDLQRRAQSSNSEFARVRTDAVRNLQIAVNKALAEIAKENKLKLILNRKAVALFADPMDITPVVLERLDKQFPSYTVKIPTPGQ